MDDKLMSEVMDDIEDLMDSHNPHRNDMCFRFRQVMTDYEHLELQMLQARNIIAAATDGLENWKHHCPFDDAAFAILSHAKAFLEENDG